MAMDKFYYVHALFAVYNILLVFFVCLFQDYVLQPDGSVTPVCKVQNLVLDEQRAGEILTLAQVLTDHLL